MLPVRPGAQSQPSGPSGDGWKERCVTPHLLVGITAKVLA